MITLAAWVLTLPLRIAWQLGLRRTLIGGLPAGVGGHRLRRR